jgi:UV DNA damage repair endonuclease
MATGLASVYESLPKVLNMKIGFACKWIDRADQVDGIGPKDDCKKYNTGATTVAWLNRQTREVAEQRLWDLMKQNIESTRLLVQRVGELDDGLRMVRLSSDILPVYTEPSWCYFWQLPDVKRYAEGAFAKVGRVARDRGVRLSFHPGQFTVLASDNPEIVRRSLEEFEYHATMAAWMGFAQRFQDFKINVHIAGRAGPAGIRQAYSRLSPEARNTITVENEEISYGLDDCLSLADIVPTVLDIHHHFIREGEYIQRNDDRVERVIDSWRGIRPVAHYSVSREDLLIDHCPNTLPNFTQLLETGYKKQKLRAHSNFMWNAAVNKWAYTFWDSFDCMVEAKAKNLASFQLYEFWKSLENTVSPVFKFKTNTTSYA